jgi:hypothetical protein
MNVLYGEERTKTEVYRYEVNQSNKLRLNAGGGSRYVVITFENEKFVSVTHNLGNFCERSNWHVFKAIAEKIETIEQVYANTESK